MRRKIRVGVLFGGQSSEHEVSLASARSVMGALDTEKYDIVPIGITKSGVWLTTGDPMKQLQSGSVVEQMPQLSSVLAPEPSGEGRAEIVQLGRGQSGSEELSAYVSEALDVIFPVLHGPYGEDGTVQGMLELAGIPYVGAGVLGSAVGMDKGVMKAVFTASGLPVGPYVLVTESEWARDPAAVRQRAEQMLTYPMFVKPANMGSSVGVSKVHGPEEFEAGIDLARQYDERLLVEQGLDARELECAVLGNDDPEASVVGEIVPGNEFYDFRAKYVDDNSDLRIPAEVPDRIAQEVRRLAVEAFKAVGVTGMARVDFFVARDLSQIWLNELNTIPGFTRISMYPKLWEASGLQYSALLDRLVELAVERHARRRKYRQALNEVGSDFNL